MASRLSKLSIPAVYHGGCHNVSCDYTRFSVEDLWNLQEVDRTLASNDRCAIASLEPQRVYHAILRRGPETSLEVLKCLSSEQLGRIIDYDVWYDDGLVPKRFFYWFDLLKQASPEHAVQTFRQLDDEYQIASLSGLIRIYDQDEYERLDAGFKDSLFRFPADALYYEIASADQDLRAKISSFIDLVMAYDINYAFALVTNAAMLPPRESEFLLRQFRVARLEEDGFVTQEESERLFASVDINLLRPSEIHTANHKMFSVPSGDYPIFIDQVLEQLAESDLTEAKILEVKNSFVFLANTLCATAGLDLDDRSAFSQLLMNIKALSSLGLEYSSQGDLTLGVELVTSNGAKTLFQVGNSLVRSRLNAFCAQVVRNSHLNLRQMQRLFKLRKYGMLLDWIDVNLGDILTYQDLESLKGVFNRFPIISTSLSEEKMIQVPIHRLCDIEDLNLFLARITECLESTDQRMQ